MRRLSRNFHFIFCQLFGLKIYSTFFLDLGVKK